VLVCGGVLILEQQPIRPESKFKVPYFNGKYIVPLVLLVALVLVFWKVPGYYTNLFRKEGLPMLVFFIVAIVVAIYTFLKNFSLIPVLGLLSCFYLMAQESHTNWYRFLIWLVIGLIVYFTYGRWNSRLAKNPSSA
jgi:hypothetical protein